MTLTDQIAKEIGRLAGAYRAGDLDANEFSHAADAMFDPLRKMEAENATLQVALDDMAETASPDDVKRYRHLLNR